jgi:hypothetical protein
LGYGVSSSRYRRFSVFTKKKRSAARLVDDDDARPETRSRTNCSSDQGSDPNGRTHHARSLALSETFEVADSISRRFR